MRKREAKKDPQKSILVVKDISPTDLVNFYEMGISALVMDKGGITSHASIIAQSLDILAWFLPKMLCNTQVQEIM